MGYRVAEECTSLTDDQRGLGPWRALRRGPGTGFWLATGRLSVRCVTVMCVGQGEKKDGGNVGASGEGSPGEWIGPLKSEM